MNACYTALSSYLLFYCILFIPSSAAHFFLLFYELYLRFLNVCRTLSFLKVKVQHQKNPLYLRACPANVLWRAAPYSCLENLFFQGGGSRAVGAWSSPDGERKGASRLCGIVVKSHDFSTIPWSLRLCRCKGQVFPGWGTERGESALWDCGKVAWLFHNSIKPTYFAS